MQVNDKVRIKNDLSKLGDPIYKKIMKKYEGKETIITDMLVESTKKQYFTLEIDNGLYVWSGEMLESLSNFDKAVAKHKELLQKKKENNTSIKHQNYYNKGIEVYKFINSWDLNFNRGNAIKYLCRSGLKDKAKEIEDLKKAINYIEFEIERLEKE